MAFRIGNIDIQWIDGALELPADPMIAAFSAEASEKEAIIYHADTLRVEELVGMNVLKYSGGYELLEGSRGLFFLNHWGSCRYAYGFWMDDLDRRDSTPIYFHSELHKEPTLYLSYLFSTIGLHRKLLYYGAAVLHASYIDYKGNGILFLGSSGTGKSTQAGLWKEHAGAEIINGDRVLIRETENGWFAFGYPCCGSSDICINRTLPVRAVVLLQQWNENRIAAPTPFEKIRALAAATEVYPWNTDEVDLALQLAERIARGVPVLRLKCRPDAQSVSLLRSYLEEEL